GPKIPTWQARSIEELRRVPGTSLALLAFNPEGSSDGSRGGSLLFRAYVASHPPRALRTVDMTLAFQGVPSVRCDPTSQGEFTHRYAESDVRRIRAYDLDFLLQCGLGILGGEILHAARYGVWSFQHDDEPPYRGIPACLWRYYNAAAVTREALSRVAGRGGGVALRSASVWTALTSRRHQV